MFQDFRLLVSTYGIHILKQLANNTIIVILVLVFVENHARHAKNVIPISSAVFHYVRCQSLRKMKKCICFLNVVVVS